MSLFLKGLVLLGIFVIAGLLAWLIAKTLYHRSDESNSPTPADDDNDSGSISDNQEGVS